jgi:peptide/nickel transport system substrate-binding protein
MLSACAAPSPSAQSPGGGQPQVSTPAAPKIMVAAISEDPKNLWDGINGGGGSGAREIGHLVNQYLAILKVDGTPEPRLLAELPSVDKGTWNINADGTMEVTYKLRSGVTWHDGTPFSADDVVFSWRVGKDAAIPNGNQSAVRLIKDVVAVDPQTAVMSWSATYPFADRLEHRELYPLPAHILGDAYANAKEAFTSQPYFNDEYIGLGPFKLAKWDHGSSIDLVANDAYFLGRPKLDRMRIMFITDPNTVLANLRAGGLNIFFPPGGPRYEGYQPLKDEWASNKRGQILNESVRWTMAEIQKSALAQPADLTDARVRQALLMAINRPELAQTVYGADGQAADSWLHPRLAYYAQIKDTIAQYPYDARRAQAQLAEVGWTPGPDGVLQKGGQRFQIDLTYTSDAATANIVRDNWKAIGVDTSLSELTPFQLRDAQARASYTGGDITSNPLGGLSAVRRFASEQTPTAANRYAGTNRGSFSNPDWDSIGERMRFAVVDDERIQLEGQLLRVFSANLPGLPLYFELQSVPVTGITGVQPIVGVAHTGNIMHTPDAHLWDVGP